MWEFSSKADSGLEMKGGASESVFLESYQITACPRNLNQWHDSRLGRKNSNKLSSYT